MSWARIDDRFCFHRKVLAAGNEAVGAYVRMIAYSSAEGTDGVIAAGTALLIGGSQAVIDRLLAAGLLEKTSADDYEIHDFLHYNPPAAEAKAKREAAIEQRRAAGLKGAESRWRADGERHGGSPSTSPSEPPSGSPSTRDSGGQWRNDGPDPDPDPDPRSRIPNPRERARAHPTAKTKTGPPDMIAITDDLRAFCAGAGAPTPTQQHVAAYLLHAREQGAVSADWGAGFRRWMLREGSFSASRGAPHIVQRAPPEGRAWKSGRVASPPRESEVAPASEIAAMMGEAVRNLESGVIPLAKESDGTR